MHLPVDRLEEAVVVVVVEPPELKARFRSSVSFSLSLYMINAVVLPTVQLARVSLLICPASVRLQLKRYWRWIHNRMILLLTGLLYKTIYTTVPYLSRPSLIKKVSVVDYLK